VVEPLRNRRENFGALYTRRPQVEAEITAIKMLQSNELVKNCQKNKGSSGYVSTEALLYFVWHSLGANFHSSLHNAIQAGECDHRAKRTGTRGQVYEIPCDTIQSIQERRLEWISDVAACELAGVPSAVPDMPDLKELLAHAIRETVRDNGWSRLAAVGGLLGKTHTSFDPRNYGFKKLSDLVRAQPYLQVNDAPDSAGFVHIELKLK